MGKGAGRQKKQKRKGAKTQSNNQNKKIPYLCDSASLRLII